MGVYAQTAENSGGLGCEPGRFRLQATTRRSVAIASRSNLDAVPLRGVRVLELQWQPGSGLPCLDVDPLGDWTLRVLRKGAKERSIPLPRQCADVLRNYRLARGLPAAPHAVERVPLIHGEKGTSLGARGLYDEVKGVFLDVADRIEPDRPGEAAILRTASPHWLRHAYARTLIVDRLVPLQHRITHILSYPRTPREHEQERRWRSAGRVKSLKQLIWATSD